MNAKTLLVIPISLFVAGCVGDDVVKVGGCESRPIPGTKCSNLPGTGPDNPEVNFNKNGLALAPPWVCAKITSTIKFKITPVGDTGTVSVFPKNAADTWLTGTNYPDSGEISITVPSYVADKSDHEYTIVTNDGECLDPRVRVEN